MRPICKKLAYLIVIPAVILFFLEHIVPMIVDLIWPVTLGATVSLKAILDLQIQLYNLEVELTQMLGNDTNPLQTHFNEHLEPNLSVVESTSRALENYVQNYGPVDLEEVGQLIDSFATTQKLLAQFAESFTEMKNERVNQLIPLNDRVIELSSLWTKWVMHKHVDHLAGLNFVLNQQTLELKGPWTMRSLNDSIALMEKLVHEFEKADKLVTEVANLGFEKHPAFSENSPILVDNNNGTHVKVTLSLLRKLLRKDAFLLYKKRFLQFRGVALEILTAMDRVQKLLQQVIKTEETHWDELNEFLLERMGVISKLQESSSKFALNIQLRMAPRLEDEDTKDEH